METGDRPCVPITVLHRNTSMLYSFVRLVHPVAYNGTIGNRAVNQRLGGVGDIETDLRLACKHINQNLLSTLILGQPFHKKIFVRGSAGAKSHWYHDQ